MKEQLNTITCPNCGTEINVNEILYHQIKEHVNSDFRKKLAEKEKEFKLKESKIRNDVQASIEKELTEKHKKHELEIKKELARKDLQLKEMSKLKLETERMKKENLAIKKTTEAEMKLKMERQLADETIKIKKKADADSERKLMEQDIKIKQLNKLLTEATRKAEQGSIQLQGEAQEVCIEQWLKKMFRDDEILEVNKGVKGGDCIHIVNHNGNQCAKIYYESKRTKVFKSDWVDKLRKDMMMEKANVGVIITEAMPRGTKDLAYVNGIWICSYEASKSLCLVIREFVVKAYEVTAVTKGKDDKMEMLYDYLTGDEFRLNIETIFNKLAEMKMQIDKEKADTVKLWKKREELIESMIRSASGVCISIKQITGKRLPGGDSDLLMLQG